MQRLVGYSVDRDEAVEESHLASAFRKIADKWKVCTIDLRPQLIHGLGHLRRPVYHVGRPSTA